MNAHRSLWAGDRRGIAALEFALIVPVLLLLLGGIVDFGLATLGKSQLTNGVAQGVQYALLQGPSVTAANVKTIVQNGASRSGLAAAVAVTVTGPACYCVASAISPPHLCTSGSLTSALTSSLPVLSSSYACTGTCSSPAVAPGVFVTITARFTYQPLMPFYSKLANASVCETGIARLK